MLKKSDVFASLVIGELAALLMFAIGKNASADLPPLALPLLSWLPFVFPIFTLVVIAVGTAAGRTVSVAYQLSKFALVGGLSFLIDLGVLNLCIYSTGIAQGFYANVFKGIAFLIAMTSSYFWNKFWTFRAAGTPSGDGGMGAEFFQFFVVSGVGFLINVSTFAFLNDWVGPQSGIQQETWASVAAAGAAIVGLVWNFLGYKFIVFRKRVNVV